MIEVKDWKEARLRIRRRKTGYEVRITRRGGLASAPFVDVDVGIKAQIMLDMLDAECRPPQFVDLGAGVQYARTRAKSEPLAGV